MASKSIDWDELLLTNDPKKKEIEVSFKKIDGDGYISFGDEPGTPGGVEEGADGSQDPDKDDEGDFEEVIGDEENPSPPGDPINPDPEDHPECQPQDCSAYDNYVDPPGVTSAVLWGTTSLQLPGDTVPGMKYVRTDNLGAGQGYPLQEILRNSMFRYAGATAAGPCNESLALFGVSSFPLFSSATTWVPDPVLDVAALEIGPGGSIEIEGEVSVYVWMRDLNGNIPTSGTKTAGLIYNTCFAWTGSYIAQSNFVRTNGLSVTVFQNSDTGQTGFNVGGELVYFDAGGDASGAYTMSFSNKITRSIDGEGVFVTAETKVSGKGADIERVQIAAKETSVNGCWFPRLRDSSSYPNYFVGQSNFPYITGAAHGGNAGQINDWVDAWERSQIQYTPPSYCERIP